MGRQIIKQPDGRYAVWSSVVDSFVMIDASPEEIIDDMLADEKDRIQKQVAEVIAKLAAGKKPYHQFTMTWAEAMATHAEIHGEAFDLEAERAAAE